MKKLLLQNHLYFILLIFSVSLSIQSCTTDEIIEVKETKHNLSIESVTLSEFQNNPLFASVLDVSGVKEGNLKSSSTKQAMEYEILTDEISKASYRDYEAFTFRINNPDQPPLTFDNYVIRKRHDGTLEEFILRYQYDLTSGNEHVTSFQSITQFDTNYNLISSSYQKKDNSKAGNKQSVGDCYVSTAVFHKIPDGREFEFVEGSVCQHPGECQITIEYTITCFGGGGGDPEPGDPSGGTDPGTGGSVPPPDNGGPTEPITTLQPPLGQEGTTNTLEQLQSIIEQRTSIVASEGELVNKTSALIAYLAEVNSPVFSDLQNILAYNLYDTTLTVSDRNILWRKNLAIYNIIKNNNPSVHTSFDNFFNTLDAQEQETYTKNSLETALFSSVKSITNYWPQNESEWGVVFKMMSPLLLEMGIEFLPFGGVFNSSKDTLAGLSKGDYTSAVIGVVGLIMEFVPWAKVVKIASKVYDVGKSVFKMFKIAYNFMDSMVTAMEFGLKTVLDNGVLKFYDNAGLQVAKISNDILTFKYSGFGGDVITTPGKTTTIIGRKIDQVDGGRTGKVIDSGFSKSGENINGINALDFDGTGMSIDEQWQINENWLNDVIYRNDVIRAVSNPLEKSNIFYDTRYLTTFLTHLKT